MATEQISVLRVRIGVLLFLLWWLPVYLLAPAIADLLGSSNDAHLLRQVTIWLVCIQTVIGLVGLYLAGKQLFATLGKVRRRRVLPLAWRIVWTGDTRIADSDLRSPKTGGRAGRSGQSPLSQPTGKRPTEVAPTRVDDLSGVRADPSHDEEHSP